MTCGAPNSASGLQQFSRARKVHMATKGGGKGNNPMTPKAAARIQSATAKSSGGGVEKGSFSARAQSAAATNVKVTGNQAAKAASTTLTSNSTGKASKSAAGSALSQVAPKKATSTSAASAASKVLRDGRTSAASKTAAGSALSQAPAKKITSTASGTSSGGPRKPKK